jgi:hypothetical protein
MAYPLTKDEIRKHLPDYPTGAAFDDALQRLLNTAQAAIDRAAGPPGNVVEWFETSSKYVHPSRPAAGIVSVKELVGTTETTLATNDYRLWPGGATLERLVTGTNARGAWTGRVVLEYTPARPTEVEREFAQLQLVKLFLAYHPGLTQETIGSWSQAFASNERWNWAIERDAILEALGAGSAVAIA